MGAQLILSPSAWAVDADHDNAREPYGQLWIATYTELARLYGLTIIGVSNVGWIAGGPWQGRKCIGCSLAVGPGGEILAQGPYGEGAEALIEVEIQPRPPVGRGTDFAAALQRVVIGGRRSRLGTGGLDLGIVRRRVTADHTARQYRISPSGAGE